MEKWTRNHRLISWEATWAWKIDLPRKHGKLQELDGNFTKNTHKKQMGSQMGLCQWKCVVGNHLWLELITTNHFSSKMSGLLLAIPPNRLWTITMAIYLTKTWQKDSLQWVTNGKAWWLENVGSHDGRGYKEIVIGLNKSKKTNGSAKVPLESVANLPCIMGAAPQTNHSEHYEVHQSVLVQLWVLVYQVVHGWNPQQVESNQRSNQFLLAWVLERQR